MEGILIPQKIFVGDPAEFIFPVSSIEDFNSEILKNGNFNIEKIVQNESMTVTGIQIKIQEKEYISIFFIPWETGNISFPSLKEAGISSPLPYVNVSSILEMSGSEILQPPRSPIIIPGTTYLIYMTAFISAMFIFAGIIIFINIKKTFFSHSFSRIQKQRINFLLSSLKKLQKKYNLNSKQNISDEDVLFLRKEWLKEFESIFRKYCFSLITCSHIRKSKLSGEALTYSEIILKLQNIFNDKNILKIFEDIFFNLQKLRFGKTDILNLDFKKHKIFFLQHALNIINICEPKIQTSEPIKQNQELNSGGENDKF